MKKKEQIILETDALESMKPLSDAECGRLVRALLEYRRSGKAPELRGNERMLFPTFRAKVDDALKEQQEKSRKYRENIRKRWDKADTIVYDCIPLNTTVYNGISEKRKSPHTPLKKKEIPPIVPHEPDAFDAFWAEYPRKVSKVAARKAFAKADAPLEVLLAALRAHKKTEQWTRDGGQYIPYPASWLNGRMWEDELEIETEARECDRVPDFE